VWTLVVVVLVLGASVLASVVHPRKGHSSKA